MSRVVETLEDTYIDLESYILTKKQYIEDRFKVLTKERKKLFIQTYVSRMQELLNSIPPEIRQCLNTQFPNQLFVSNTDYEQPYYAKLRTILEYILTDGERETFRQTQQIIPFYTRVLERFNEEAFLDAYLKKYSKPINMYAFYLVRTLKHRLKLDIRICLYHLEQRQQQSHSLPRDTHEYKHRLTTPEKNAFTYKWLKTPEDIKAVCKDDDDEDDECNCAIFMTPLEPNKAFSVSYELNGKPYTDCYDEIVIYHEAALPYKYYRHPVLKDKYIDMGAIRALKAAANATGGRASSTAAKPKGGASSRGRSASGGKQVVNRASKSKLSSLIK